MNSERLFLVDPYDEDHMKLVEDFEKENEIHTMTVENAKKILGEFPNCIIYGKDKDIFKCFSKETVKNISEVYVDRNSLLISATKMRELLTQDNKEKWMKYADSKIHYKYDELKEKLDKLCCK